MSARVASGVNSLGKVMENNGNKFYNGFDPIIAPDSRVLILGSFPSVVSRERGFYYANPQNRFWRTLERFFGISAPTVQDKIELVLNNKIALYDVYEKSSIKGSSDSALNEDTARVAQLEPLFEIATDIRLVICNGKKAYSAFITAYPNLNIKSVCLPSTSSANPRYDYKVWANTLSSVLK